VRLAEVAIDPHDFAGGLHLRPEDRVHPRELDEREDRLLDGDVRELTGVVGGVGSQRVAQHRTRRDLRERQPDRLRDEGHGSRGARVHLEDVDRLALDRELYVDEADDSERLRQRFRLLAQRFDLVLDEAIPWASSSERAVAPEAWRSPRSVMSSWKRWRSSARSMASGEVPRIGTPASRRGTASLSGVWPPNWTTTPSGRSFSTMFRTSSSVRGSK